MSNIQTYSTLLQLFDMANLVLGWSFNVKEMTFNKTSVMVTEFEETKDRLYNEDQFEKVFTAKAIDLFEALGISSLVIDEDDTFEDVKLRYESFFDTTPNTFS